MLDGRGEPESEEDLAGGKEESSSGQAAERKGNPAGESESNHGSDEDDEDEDGEDASFAADHASSISEDEAEANDDALQNLEAFITKLEPGQKRKAPDGEPEAQIHTQDNRPRKRRLLKERTQVGVESEFAAQPGKRSK